MSSLRGPLEDSVLTDGSLVMEDGEFITFISRNSSTSTNRTFGFNTQTGPTGRRVANRHGTSTARRVRNAHESAFFIAFMVDQDDT